MCENNHDSTERVFKGPLAQSSGCALVLGTALSLLAEGVSSSCHRTPWTVEGVNHSVMCQTHYLRSGQLRSQACFHFVFRRPDKGPRMLFCLHLATCRTLSLKAKSPFRDQKAVKWHWKKDLSTPALSFHSNCRVLHVVRFIVSCVNAVTKTNKNGPTSWVSSHSDPLPNTGGLVSVYLWRDISMNSQDTSYLICLHFSFLKHFFFLFHTFETFCIKIVFPLIFPANIVSRGQSDWAPGEQCSGKTMSLAKDSAIRKRPWVKALGDGTFWECPLWAVGSHRAQRANISGLIFTLYLLIKNILNTSSVPGLTQRLHECLNTISTLVKENQWS